MVKDADTPPMKYNKWTEEDKAELTKVMTDDFNIPPIQETELRRQQEMKFKEDGKMLVVLFIGKERGDDPVQCLR